MALSSGERAKLAFASALQSAAGGVDLPRAAAAMGILVEASLDVEAVVAEVESLAGDLERWTGRLQDCGDGIRSLNEAFFARHGWHGDADHYDDPRNCFLHSTLARRTGLPITMALVYVEVGRRLGLSLEGVGFPAHFLVRCGDDTAGYLYIDPFHQGQLIGRRELADFLQRRGWQQDGGLDRFLAALTPRQILDRMLNNIKARYLARREVEVALAAVELKLVLAPWELDEVRDRGLLAAHLGELSRAVEDLETYLAHSPDAADAGRIRARLTALRDRLRE